MWSIKWRVGNIPFVGIRPRRTLDAAGGFPRFRVEEHGKLSHSAFIVNSIPANIAYPSREIRDNDEFIAKPSEIGDRTWMHEPCGTFIARDGSGTGLLQKLVHIMDPVFAVVH
jgi:hypothetical protein